jgi:hypothetical protein
VSDTSDDAPIFCHRCGVQLFEGRGSMYIVRIEAFADPTPPVISDEKLNQDDGKQMEDLTRELSDLSAQELTDQVYRRLTLSLCTGCYKQWIENPTSVG